MSCLTVESLYHLLKVRTLVGKKKPRVETTSQLGPGCFNRLKLNFDMFLFGGWTNSSEKIFYSNWINLDHLPQVRIFNKNISLKPPPRVFVWPFPVTNAMWWQQQFSTLWRFKTLNTCHERHEWVASNSFVSWKAIASNSSWWLNQPIWKIFVKLDHFPR